MRAAGFGVCEGVRTDGLALAWQGGRHRNPQIASAFRAAHYRDRKQSGAFERIQRDRCAVRGRLRRRLSREGRSGV